MNRQIIVHPELAEGDNQTLADDLRTLREHPDRLGYFRLPVAVEQLMWAPTGESFALTLVLVNPNDSSTRTRYFLRPNEETPLNDKSTGKTATAADVAELLESNTVLLLPRLELEVGA